MALQSSAKLVAYSLIICLVLSYITIGLRLLARVQQKRSMAASDWMMIMALAAFTSYSAVLFAMAYNPTGAFDTSALPPSVLVPFLKESFASEILLGLTIMLSKLSLLLFWRAIFVTRAFRRMNDFVMGLTILWYIGTTIALFLQCNPRAGAWNAITFAHAKCIPLGHIIAGYEASNISIDIMIIGLPVNEVRNLHTSSSRKIGIMVLFTLGGFVIVTSAIRMKYTNVSLHKFGEFSTIVDLPKTYLWTNIQLGCTILCANLASLLPLLPETVKRRLHMLSSWLGSLLSSVRSSLGTRRRLPDDENKAFQRIHGQPTADLDLSKQTHPDSMELQLVNNSHTV